jgi:NTP pyrophosphatase (non-canonical NTP hydrolase)
MNWNEYKYLSEKTLSQEFHVGKQTENLLHGVVGILTELEELLSWNDEVNKKEEVADIFWYVALLDRELSLNLEISKSVTDFVQIKNEALIIQSFKDSCMLLDYLKKKIYYNKTINLDDFTSHTKSLFHTLCLFCELNDINVSEILDTNISKLKARYGEKFSSDKAINRNLELERNILENENI